MKYEQVDKMTVKYLREYLKLLIRQLDDLDGEDFFGTEGWRKYLLGDD